MKTQSMLDSALVDDIFYKINEIYMHHATFLSFMGATMKTWDSNRTIGGIIHQTVSQKSVQENVYENVLFKKRDQHHNVHISLMI